MFRAWLSYKTLMAGSCCTDITEITTHVTEATDRYFIRPAAQGGQTVLTFYIHERQNDMAVYCIISGNIMFTSLVHGVYVSGKPITLQIPGSRLLVLFF